LAIKPKTLQQDEKKIIKESLAILTSQGKRILNAHISSVHEGKKPF
jgi:hypothetical protein